MSASRRGRIMSFDDEHPSGDLDACIADPTLRNSFIGLLTQLKAGLEHLEHELLGNGQPGRIQRIESRQDSTELRLGRLEGANSAHIAGAAVKHDVTRYVVPFVLGIVTVIIGALAAHYWP